MENATSELKTIPLQILATCLILLGLYGLMVSTINSAFFSRYPTEGIYSIKIQGSNYAKREEDCRLIEDVNQAENLSEEKQAILKSNLDICWGGITQERKKIQIMDFTQSFTLLILGSLVLFINLGFKKMNVRY